MAPINTGANVVSSLQVSLDKGSPDELLQYIVEDSHLDLSAAWTAASQANDSANATNICKLISTVLLKFDVEQSFVGPASTFIRRVLTDNHRQILRNLSSLRPVYVNPTLRMLITMATFDVGAAADDVFAALDIGINKTLSKLLVPAGRQTQKPVVEVSNPKKRKREDGVARNATRNLFADLLSKMMDYCSATVQAEILQHRPIMIELFKHLPNDEDEQIMKTITSISNIFGSQDISRTVKLQSFGEAAKPLATLYTRLATDVEDTDHDGEALAEGTTSAPDKTASRERVQTSLYNFLKSITTVPGQGICFESVGLEPPPNKRLYNPILGQFIMTLQPVTSNSQQQLLLEILRTTPELIAHWTQNTEISFSPVLSQEWIRSMQLVQAIVEIPFPSKTFDEVAKIPDFVLLENIIPSPLSKIARNALQDEEDLVKIVACQTLSVCMQKLARIKIPESIEVDVLELVQKRMPLVEYIYPLASAFIDANSSETDILLRAQALKLLNQYVIAFDDIPKFDFINLFHVIMEFSETSNDEQDIVLQMLPKISDLQWLAKRKDGKSIFRILVDGLLDSPTSQSGSIKFAICELLEREPLMFKGLCGSDIPAHKSEALIRPLQNATLVREAAEAIAAFLEDCLIRFSAAPYKYWESFVDFCSTHNLQTECSFSPILMTIHEQLPFVKNRQPRDQSVFDDWFSQVLAGFICIGDDLEACQQLTTRPIPDLASPLALTMFDAIGAAIMLHGRVGSSKDDAETWKILTEVLMSPDADQVALTQFIIKLWSKDEVISPSHADYLLSAFSQAIDADSVMIHNGLLDFVRRLLIQAKDLHSNLSRLLDSSAAMNIIMSCSRESTTLTTTVKTALLNCVERLEENSTFTDTFTAMLVPKDSYDINLVVSLTRAIERDVLKAFPIHQLLPLQEMTFRATDDYWQAIGSCTAAYIQHFPRDIPEALISWTTGAKFAHATGSITEMLNAPTQELRELGRQVLEQHTIDLAQLLNSELSASTLQCVAVKAQIDHEARVKMIQIAAGFLTNLNSAFSSIGQNVTRLLTVLRAQPSEIQSSGLSGTLRTFHQAIVDDLRRPFAELRKQEGKTLEQGQLKYLPIVSTYISTTHNFEEDVSTTTLDVLADVALENQSRHPEVLEFLTAIVLSTDAKAFNYARASQAILNDPSILYAAATKSPAVGLLHAMITRHPKSANASILDEILKLYNGTISEDNKKLFDILSLLETTLQVPIGGRVKSWRLTGSIGDAIFGRKSVDMFLSSEHALHTILHFADYDSVGLNHFVVSRADAAKQTTAEDDGDLEQAISSADHAIYDVRWTIALSAGFISTDPSPTMLDNLLSHHALGLALVSLSSLHCDTRTRASQLLAIFSTAIHGSNIRAKTQLLTLLQLLTASMTSEDLLDRPVPLLHTVFLALAADILVRPTHSLYAQVNRFILARPDLDFADVPLFLDLFYAGKGYAKRVQWLLRLLVAGIRRGEGGAYARRHVLELCMGLYTAKTASQKIKDAILEFLRGSRQEFEGYWTRVGGDAWLEMVGLDLFD